MRSIDRVFRVSFALIFSVFSLVTGATTADAFAGQTTRVSVDSTGIIANTSASSGVLSGDGRYVVFTSSATNLIAGVVTTGTHVYRHENRSGGATELVSRGATGNPGNNVSLQTSISADGIHVVFSSFATDLVDGDANGMSDVFVRNMNTGTTTLVSRASAGVVGLPGSSSLSTLSGARQISEHGDYIVFISSATNLVAGVTSGLPQVYRKDLNTGEVVLASVNDAGQAGDRPSLTPTISGDGTVVAFQTASTNFSVNTPQVFVRVLPAGPTTLESAGAAAVGAPSTAPALSFDGRYLAFVSAAPLDPDDRDNGTLDVFLRDRDPSAGTTVLVSLSPNTVPGATSLRPSISDDGRWVAFDSLDEQLVGLGQDTNGVNDVFVYDRENKTVALVSLNDAGEQANAPSGLVLGGASISPNGQLVLFGSTASNLVASPSNGFNQLYVRKLVEDQPPVSFEWLAPLGDTFVVGRNLPVKFRVLGADGSPVSDDSVEVDVLDSSGAVVAGTSYVFGGQPSRSVMWNGDSYHVNVDTKDLGAGGYVLRVRFSSPTLSGQFTLPTSGTASSVRSRLRD